MANVAKIRVCLRSYDHVILDQTASKIVAMANKNHGKAVGPIPLPTEKQVFTILRAVHKYKDAREQFEIRTHKRVVDVTYSDSAVLDAIKNIDIPEGVMIELKYIDQTKGKKNVKGSKK